MRPVNRIYAGFRSHLVTLHTREAAGSNPAAPIPAPASTIGLGRRSVRLRVRGRPWETRRMTITGVHAIVYSIDAAGDRAFFANVLGLASVDAGEGWLIFGLPPAELAAHPASAAG